MRQDFSSVTLGLARVQDVHGNILAHGRSQRRRMQHLRSKVS